MQNDSTVTHPEIAIGTPVYHPAWSRRGYVVAIDEPTAKSYTIGGNGLQRDHLELTIVWENDTISEVSEHVADQWLRLARQYSIEPVTNAEERLANARAREAERREASQREAEQRARDRVAFEADAAPRIPAWAKAVILAGLVENQSNSMTDYFDSTTTRSVILAFSRHTRDLFPEMRNAARNFSETADLADAPPDAEHREKWSMGAGYYLKAGDRHSSGWKVWKRPLRQSGEAVKDLPTGEWAVPDTAPEHTRADAATTPRFTIEEHMHTKRGIPIFICVLGERIERADFDAFRERAREHGGWYSRPWHGTPGGFAFKDRASAERFAACGRTDDEGGDGPEPAPVPAIATKLRRLADSLQDAIDRNLAERTTNTPKRQLQAAIARIEGRRLSRAQAALRALANGHETRTIPVELADVATKSEVYELVGTRIDRSSASHYDAGIDTGKPALDTSKARALWRLIRDHSSRDSSAEILKQKIEKIRFARIPGFVMTPPAVADKLVELASLPDGTFDLLDPRGGTGVILDRVREVASDAALTIFEGNERLREVLELKGYEITGEEFLKADPRLRFDRIVMNPPFEFAQDIDHVRYAHPMLRAGGRLVSVMSPTSLTRQDRKARDFQNWFEQLGGEKIDLPPNSFRESETGVSAIIVMLNAGRPAP